MAAPFVPVDFDVPLYMEGPGFRLEPLGPQHNERDHAAWMSSIDHIRKTPGFSGRDWPAPMTLEANLADLVAHAVDFANRVGFTYSVLDGDEVVGCLYIYPATDGLDADVRSWVTEARSELDVTLWRTVSAWLATMWPFTNPEYAPRR
jgi:hypothetical protein